MTNDKVSFISMDEGTREDYDLVFSHDAENATHQAERVIEWLRSMDGDSPYAISRLDHSLQTATRAEEDGADEEMVILRALWTSIAQLPLLPHARVILFAPSNPPTTFAIAFSRKSQPLTSLPTFMGLLSKLISMRWKQTQKTLSYCSKFRRTFDV